MPPSCCSGVENGINSVSAGINMDAAHRVVNRRNLPFLIPKQA